LESSLDEKCNIPNGLWKEAWVSLIGVTGYISYVPVMVARQLRAYKAFQE